MADRSGVSQKTISNLVAENGVLKSPTIATMEAIAHGFGVSPAELMNYTSAELASQNDGIYLDLPELIRDFIAADPEGRKAILRVARNEAISAKQI